jgi:hypothetical protein
MLYDIDSDKMINRDGAAAQDGAAPGGQRAFVEPLIYTLFRTEQPRPLDN